MEYRNLADDLQTYTYLMTERVLFRDVVITSMRVDGSS